MGNLPEIIYEEFSDMSELVHSENYLEDDIDDKYARLYNEIHSKQEFKCGEYSCYEKSLSKLNRKHLIFNCIASMFEKGVSLQI